MPDRRGFMARLAALAFGGVAWAGWRGRGEVWATAYPTSLPSKSTTFIATEVSTDGVNWTRYDVGGGWAMTNGEARRLADAMIASHAEPSVEYEGFLSDGVIRKFRRPLTPAERRWLRNA